MKNKTIAFPELLQIFAFMLYLGGSSLALIEHGIELSLWLMTFAVVINMGTVILPWLGVNWIRLNKQGSDFGFWLSILVYLTSWGSFAYAMYFRLWRNLPQFYTMVTITTLLWSAGLLILIYSRHAYKDKRTGDKLEEDQTKPISDN